MELDATIEAITHKGKGCAFYEPLTVIRPENLILGDNVHILRGGYIDALGGITIGDNTHIAPEVLICSWNHNYQGESLPYDKDEILKPVSIGRNVWIGMRVCIIPGITIGEGAVIGMGTTVTHDVPDLAIVGVAPMRVIKYRDRAQYMKLDSEEKYGGPGGRPFSKGDVD